MPHNLESCITCMATTTDGCLLRDCTGSYSLEPGQTCLTGLIEFRGKIVIDHSSNMEGKVFSMPCNALLFKRDR